MYNIIHIIHIRRQKFVEPIHFSTPPRVMRCDITPPHSKIVVDLLNFTRLIRTFLMDQASATDKPA